MANKKQAVMAVALGVSITLSVAGARPVWAKSSGQIQQQIDQVHNKQDAKKQSIKQDQKKLGQVDQKRKQAVQKLNDLKAQIHDAQDKIDQKQADIKKTQGKIDKLKSEIADTEKRIKRRNDLLKQRVRYMYENGSTVNYLSVLLGSQSFSNFLDRVVALNLIAKQDKQLLDAQKADKKRLEGDKAAVKKELGKLQDQLGSLQTMKSQLNKKKQEESALAAKLQEQAKQIKNDISNEHQAITYIQSQIQDLIKKKEAALKKEAEARKKAAEAAARKKAAEEAAAKKKAEQSSQQSQSSSSGGSASSHSNVSAPSVSGGSGALITPIASGSYHISSGYGPRWGGFHDGIDFAAACGTPIRAAASGTVLFAGPASGFGNWIVIYLDNLNLLNVYGHMYNSGIFVHQGEHVTQGQTIGKVGSNGESTGCHVHFEVDRPNNFSGETGINPYPYF